MSRATKAQAPATRAVWLDALRGLAMVWMTLFHFCFDLSYFGALKTNFYQDPFWTMQRSAIVSLFLVCVGASQILAQQQGQTASRFWRRWMQIALCALAVSVGSWLVFPTSYIYFGVLHGIAVMLLIVRFVPMNQTARWALGAAALIAPTLALQAHTSGALSAALDGRAWNWLGLVSHKPVTEDYVPLLPWLGVVLWGQAALLWLLQRQPDALHDGNARWQSTALRPALRGLSVLGRWSLSYYMLHQPLLFGVVLGAVTLFGWGR